MTVFLFANNAHTTLAGPIASGATSCALAAGTGILFPNPSVGQQFELTFTSSQQGTGQSEIAYCTARNGDICTIIRGQEGTTPQNFLAGDAADNFLTAGTTAAFTQATQLQQQAGNYAVDTGTVNALVITRTPAPATLAQTTGEPIRIKVANANTGNTTLTDTGLPTTIIINTDGTPLDPGEIQAGAVITIIFDGTRYQLLAAVGIIHPANIAVFSTTGTFTVPAGVFLLKKVRVWGAGGGGGGVNGVAQSSGGSGGGYAEGPVQVTPGQVIAVIVGVGGAGGNGTPTNGTGGGTSSFGPLSATGGGAGLASSSGAQGTISNGGTGSGGALNLTGTTGSGGNAFTNGGAGGASPLGIAGGPSGSINNTGSTGTRPGGGGGGTACTTGGQDGGPGGNGLVIAEW